MGFTSSASSHSSVHIEYSRVKYSTVEEYSIVKYSIVEKEQYSAYYYLAIPVKLLVNFVFLHFVWYDKGTPITTSSHTL